MLRLHASKVAGSVPPAYQSAVGALRAPRGAGRRAACAPVPPSSGLDVAETVVRRLVPGPSAPAACRSAQRPQRREALRENTPPWTVRLEHRYPGKLINVSRRGLAIETREAPPFYTKGRLRVDLRGEALHLQVAVQWCRLVGLEEVETERGVETAPRFQLGLGCDDPALQRLGAPPPASGSMESSRGVARGC